MPSPMVEAFGSGVAMLDYDADGDMDLFCAGGGTISAGLEFSGSPNRLFRNEGNLKFTDVTSGSGLDVKVDYSHGVTVGDLNNDGLPDLFTYHMLWPFAPVSESWTGTI